MGVISLPANGEIAIDANILIYSVETQEPYWLLLQPLLSAAKAGQVILVASELIVLETLIMPFRTQDALLINAYAEILSSPNVRLVPITTNTLLRAAKLRAEIPGLRTPDAIHAASALQQNITSFLTNDSGFRRVPGLPVLLLSEFLNVP